MYALTLVTAPADEPVSLQEAMDHLRVDLAAEESYITTLISVARRRIETMGGFALITQTWDLRLDGFPETGYIELPRCPVASVSSLTYTDSTGSATTWDSSNYVVDVSSPFGRLTPAYSVLWPTFTAYPLHPVRVRFVAGFGGADDVPEEFKQAILLLVGELYERREMATINANVVANLASVDHLLGDWMAKVGRFG